MKVTLEVIEGPDAGRDFVYEGFQSFVLGRGGQLDLNRQTPSDPYMSRHHLLFVSGGGRCTVRDLGSFNGIYVNGRRLEESVLADGDRIRAGRTTMRVHIEGDADSISALSLDLSSTSESRLGDYALVECLGRGAVSEVWRARDHVSGTDVALKLLPLGPIDTDLAVEHFLREMEIHEQLDHPSIVRILNEGREGERLWFAMEFVSGETLEARVIRAGPMEVADVVSFGVDLLDALDYAHGLGFVHRDIKPANLLLPAGGEPPLKVVDFGLAKSFRDPGSPSLTSSGHLKGTPRYMAREQLLDAKRAGPKADIFAAGACLYFALTAAWHYDASGGNMWNAILTQDPVPLTSRRPEVDPDLAALIRRTLDPDPDKRPESAREMLHSLKTFACVRRRP